MKWISVKDRLPKVPKDKHAVGVIVSVSDEDDYPPGWMQAAFKNGKFRVAHYRVDGSFRYEVLHGVTHWMIPVPPDDTGTLSGNVEIADRFDGDDVSPLPDDTSAWNKPPDEL